LSQTPAMMQALVAGELDDTALRREVPAQDGKTANRLDRILDRDDDFLARPLLDRGCDLPERTAVDVGRVRMDELALQQLPRDERDTAGLVHVRGDEPAARLQAGDDRGAGRDGVEVVQLERKA